MKAKDIIGICSGKNEALVREHGATDVIDYTKVLWKIFLNHEPMFISSCLE